MEESNKFEVELRKGASFEMLSSHDPELYKMVKVQMKNWERYMGAPDIEKDLMKPLEYFGNVKSEPIFQEMYKRNLADAEKYIFELNHDAAVSDGWETTYRYNGVEIALKIAAGLLTLEEALKENKK